jgi:hypothetical protein
LKQFKLVPFIALLVLAITILNGNAFADKARPKSKSQKLNPKSTGQPEGNPRVEHCLRLQIAALLSDDENCIELLDTVGLLDCDMGLDDDEKNRYKECREN